MFFKLHNLLQYVQRNVWIFFPQRTALCLKDCKMIMAHLRQTRKFLQTCGAQAYCSKSTVYCCYSELLNVYRDAAKALRTERFIIYLHTISKKILYLYIKKLNVGIIKIVLTRFVLDWCFFFLVCLFLKYLFDLTNTSNTLKTVYFVVQSKTRCILCILCLVLLNLFSLYLLCISTWTYRNNGVKYLSLQAS